MSCWWHKVSFPVVCKNRDNMWYDFILCDVIFYDQSRPLLHQILAYPIVTACHTLHSHNQCMYACAKMCLFVRLRRQFRWFHLSTLVCRVEPRCQKPWPLSALSPFVHPVQTSTCLLSQAHRPSLCPRVLSWYFSLFQIVWLAVNPRMPT